MAKISVDFDSKRLRRNIRQLPREIDQKVSAVIDYNAAWGQGQMRLQAPWSDDTGAARGGLTALPGHYGNTHEILLAYSVYYGIWLEVANSGRYQILIPMLRIIGEKVMRDLNGLLDRM